jgi:hypothetical protein
MCYFKTAVLIRCCTTRHGNIYFFIALTSPDVGRLPMWNVECANLVTYFHSYCHAFSDRRRVLDWQLDLLQSYTKAQYNWVSPDSLSLTTHWLSISQQFRSHRNCCNPGNRRTPGSLPSFPWIPTHSTANSKLNNSPTTPWIPTPSIYSKTENSEVYDLWSDCRGDSAFGIGCLAIT